MKTSKDFLGVLQVTICTKGRSFPREVILVTLRWCLSYGLSYRERQEMLKEKGVSVNHSAIYRWVEADGPQIEQAIRKQRKRAGLS